MIAGNAQPNESDPHTISRRIAEFVIHPNYKFRTMVSSNDLMLVRIRDELLFDHETSTIGPICLPNRVDTSAFCVTAGYGYTHPGGMR